MKYKIIFLTILIAAIFLRTYKLDTIPPSLNWDEAAIAWNGFSIGKTHLDEYGTKFPLVFRSFGDFKAPGLIYVLAILTRIFGLSIWTIRLPVALAGIATVVLSYLLAIEISKNLKLSKSNKKYFPILAMGLMSFNYWNIFFSRGAFEAMLALSLTMLGVWLFLISVKKTYLLPISYLSFLGAMYSYHSPKIFIPLFGLVLLILYTKDILKNLTKVKYSIILLLTGLGLALYCTIPLLKVSFIEKGSGRLDTSIFYDDKNQAKPINFSIALNFTNNYLFHLDPGFLLFGGNLENYRTELKNTGKITIIEYIFLIIGIIYLIKVKNKIAKLLLFWLLIGVIPAAIGKEVPHAIRSLNMLPAIIFISSLGFIYVWPKIAKQKLLLGLIVAVYILQFSFFIKDYFVQFPVYAASDWQYGMEEVTKIAHQYENQIDKIIITTHYSQPHVLTYVYQKKNPIDVIYGLMGQKYQFREINWEGDQFCKSCLLIGTEQEIPQEFPGDIANLISETKFPDGSVAFRIIKTKNENN